MVDHHDKLADFASVPFQGTVTEPGCPVAAHCFQRGLAATRGPYCDGRMPPGVKGRHWDAAAAAATVVARCPREDANGPSVVAGEGGENARSPLRCPPVEIAYALMAL